MKKSEISTIARANGAKCSAAAIARYVEETKRKLLHVYGFKMVECNAKDSIADVALSQDLSSQGRPDMFLLLNALSVPKPVRPRGEGGAGGAAAAADDDDDRVGVATSRLLAMPLSVPPAPAPVDFHLAMLVMSIVVLER